MALAKKCDRCGKLYEMYPPNDEDNVWNAVALMQRTVGFCDSSEPMDLCPDCMVALQRFLDRVDILNTEGDSNAEN